MSEISYMEKVIYIINFMWLSYTLLVKVYLRFLYIILYGILWFSFCIKMKFVHVSLFIVISVV